MTAWRAYPLTYIAKSDLHLGNLKLGFIQKTRYFIPGWTLWGAITAQLTRKIYSKAEPEHYIEIGGLVREHIRTSYAYITHDQDLLIPDHSKGTEKFGPLTKDEFERNYITSYGKNATNPYCMAAEEGALYEIEVISKRNLITKKPVKWQFFLYLNFPWDIKNKDFNALRESDILDALSKLTIGGERKYGLGLLHRDDERQIECHAIDEEQLPYDYEVGSKILTAHAYVTSENLEVISGPHEDIPLRWWCNNSDNSDNAYGPGQKRQVWSLYSPGGVIRTDKTPKLGYYGIWQFGL